MTDFNALCKMAEDLPAEVYPEVLRETAARVLPALEGAAGSRERAEMALAAFIIASVYADGTLDKGEYALLRPNLEAALGGTVPFEAVKEYIENSKADGKQLQEFTDAMCDYLGMLSEELQSDVVLLALLICAVDGKVGAKEKKYIKKLIR